MSIFDILKCCMRGEVEDCEVLPLVRVVSLNIMPKSITSHLPILTKPVPQLHVSVSSSTAVALFDHESNVSMRSPHNSYTSNDTFEDVDLSTPTKFATPPKVRKAIASLFDDQHEADSASVVSGSLNKGKEVSDASSPCPKSATALGKQPVHVASPFDDGHEVELESAVEYAPTTSYSGNEYTERAMEYQRGESPLPPSLSLSLSLRNPCTTVLTIATACLLFGNGSPEYNNLQRDHTLAVLEGTRAQSTQPLE